MWYLSHNALDILCLRTAMNKEQHALSLIGLEKKKILKVHNIYADLLKVQNEVSYMKWVHVNIRKKYIDQIKLPNIL